MNFFGSKERVYSDDTKLVAIIMGSLIVIASILTYAWVTITCIETKHCLAGMLP